MSDVTDATTVSDDVEALATDEAASAETDQAAPVADVAEEAAPVADETASEDAPASEDAEEVEADTSESTDSESTDSEAADSESTDSEPADSQADAEGASESEDAEDAEDAEEGEGAEEGEDEEAPRRRRDSPYDRPGRWYVIHTQSGYENKVRSNLLARTQSMNMEERIFEVVIPLEDVVEFKNGKKVVVQKKVFPGYLLTRMRLDDDSWFVVRNTPGVTGFIGAGNKPSPLPRRDVENFLTVKEEGGETTRKGRPRLEYQMGETVRVKEGPFADFQGEIVEINEDQLRLKVLVNIFGRETPVELQFSEVAKI